MIHKKKLIEVALPLDAINKASAREKSIRHGHPSTLHLWWARRPLAAARGVGEKIWHESQKAKKNGNGSLESRSGSPVMGGDQIVKMKDPTPDLFVVVKYSKEAICSLQSQEE